ncbi:MAG: hypothetical protein JXA14_26250 [Anaerolineae bacterium]|nr:hypothetical protein [Anaerolineae bacterium]
MQDVTPRVVIEYEYPAYHAPEDFYEAFDVKCRVTFARGASVAGDYLLDVRDTLEELGFTRHGAHQIRRQNHGRYCPTWREVWVAA